VRVFSSFFLFKLKSLEKILNKTDFDAYRLMSYLSDIAIFLTWKIAVFFRTNSNPLKY